MQIANPMESIDFLIVIRFYVLQDMP